MIRNGSDSFHNFADGNDAAAWGAEDAGVGFVSHYPGAPVNRVAEVLAGSSRPVIFNHALNEHIAALTAIGASLCGARSLVVMKHVGLNIAADPLNYAGAVNISGGMVVLVGTDPGARSSTGEEDVHWYAPQFGFPLLEPTSVQDVYGAVIEAFDLSERARLPVLVFVPGRIAYQSALISRDPRPVPVPEYTFAKNPETLINVGMKAVKNHREHLQRLASVGFDGDSPMIAGNPAADYGIVTRGAAYAVVCETIGDLSLMERVHVLNIRRTFPLHRDSLVSFARGKKKLVIMEDQDGFLETMIKREAFGAITCPVQGKEIFPAWGELHYEQIRDFLATEFGCTVDFPLPLAVPPVPDRPGACCEGCPHRPALYAIEQALEEGRGITGGDIGCSSLPPHRTDWLLCMNAGIGISQGIAQLLPDRPLVSTGGDGSLFHGGLLSLQSAVENGINLTHIILDNRSVAMTGHQPSPTGTGRLDLRGLLHSIGVRRIFEVSAFTPSLLILAIEKAKKLDGVKVIRVKGECALQREERQPDYRQRFTLRINPEKCHGCTICYSGLQCPSIVRADATGQLSIDTQRCRRCGACLDVCPNNAILINRHAAAMAAALPGIVRRFRRVAFQLMNP